MKKLALIFLAATSLAAQQIDPSQILGGAGGGASIANIAALRTYGGSGIVNVSGYYTAADGGGGVFIDMGAPAVLPLTLTAVANASAGSTVYTGTITGGAANAYAGQTFTISGFSNAANNGAFSCTASSSTTITLSNAAGTAETHAGVATSMNTNDGGVTIYDSATGESWKRQIPNKGTIIDAWFGVKNDNSTDNAAAIQAGWDYMCSARAGKFQFQSGKIRYGTTPVKKCAFDLSGAGWNINGATYGTTLIYTGSTSPGIRFANAASIYTFMFDSFHDIGLAYGGSATSTWINAIEFGNPTDSLLLNGTIDHVAFDAWPGGDLWWKYTAPTTWVSTFTGYISDGTGAAPGNILCVTSGTPTGNYLNGTSIPANTFIVANVAADHVPVPVTCTGAGAGTPYYLNPTTSLNISSETMQANYGSGTYYQNLTISNILTQGDGQFVGFDNEYMNGANVVTLENIDHENSQAMTAAVAHAYADLTGFQGVTVNRFIYEGAAPASPYLFAMDQASPWNTVSNVWIENGASPHFMAGLTDFIYTGYTGPHASFHDLNLLPVGSFTDATFHFSDFVANANIDVYNSNFNTFTEGTHTAYNRITTHEGSNPDYFSKAYISKIATDCGHLRGSAIVDPASIKACMGSYPDVYMNQHGGFFDGMKQGPASISTTKTTEGIVADSLEGRVFEVNRTGADPNFAISFQPTTDMVGSQISVSIRWDLVTAQSDYGLCFSPGTVHNVRAVSGMNGWQAGGNSCLVADVPHNVWQTSIVTTTVPSTSPMTIQFNRAFDAAAPSGAQTIRVAAVFIAAGAQIPFTMSGANAAQPITWLGAAAPTSGTYIVGDMVTNSAPASGVPSAWVNTVAGSPGTWTPLANIP